MLRETTEADLPTFYEHQRDPRACAMAVFKPRERPAFFEHWRTKILGSRSTLTRTIELDGQVAGYVSSFQSGPERLVCYWLGREHWGRGVASTALAEFLAQVERARPLDAFVATSNAGSIRVLEKCGFALVPDSRTTGEDGVEEVRLRLR